MVPLWLRVDLGTMVFKGYTVKLQYYGSHTIILFSVISRTLVKRSLLNIDRKIPLTCCISCEGGITGSAPISKSKQNIGCSPADGYVNCIGSMLGGMSTGNLEAGDMTTRICMGIQNIIQPTGMRRDQKSAKGNYKTSCRFGQHKTA